MGMNTELLLAESALMSASSSLYSLLVEMPLLHHPATITKRWAELSENERLFYRSKMLTILRSTGYSVVLTEET